MPKIPTFTSKARPTAEVGSIQSNIRIDPNRTMGAALSTVAGSCLLYTSPSPRDS